MPINRKKSAKGQSEKRLKGKYTKEEKYMIETYQQEKEPIIECIIREMRRSTRNRKRPGIRANLLTEFLVNNER